MGNIENAFGILAGATTATVPKSASPQAEPFVVLSSDQLSALSDDALQQYIKDVGARMLDAHCRWQELGCFDACGERDRLWRAEQEALHERWKRPHLVEAMEQERGLGA